VVYSRKIQNKTYTFGVSGRLYKSNVLFYDHQTESLWSQLLSTAISGKMAGTELTKVNSSRVKWKTWRKKNPETHVLSTDTGFIRNYATDPYEGYYRIGTIWFPVGKVRKDLPPKTRVLGIELGGTARAYSLAKLQQEKGPIMDQLNGITIRIRLNEDREVVAVTDDNGKPIPHLFAFWFAWQAFNPRTTVYRTK
jgi:hypothetical protein